MGYHHCGWFRVAGETEGAVGDWSFSCHRNALSVADLTFRQRRLSSFPAFLRSTNTLTRDIMNYE